VYVCACVCVCVCLCECRFEFGWVSGFMCVCVLCLCVWVCLVFVCGCGCVLCLCVGVVCAHAHVCTYARMWVYLCSERGRYQVRVCVVCFIQVSFLFIAMSRQRLLLFRLMCFLAALQAHPLGNERQKCANALHMSQCVCGVMPAN